MERLHNRTATPVAPTSTPTRAATEPLVAPFALARVAALPYEALLALTPPRTAALLDEAIAGARRLEALRDPLVDQLSVAVQGVTDRAARSQALTLRRDVFNARSVATDPQVIERVGAHLPANARASLDAWAQVARRQVEINEELERSAEAEQRAHCRPRLLAVAASEPLASALALASPTLCEGVRDRASSLDKRSTKVDRALFAYVMRSAAKTSPFAGFMHTGLCAVGTTAAPAAVAAPVRSSRLRINRALLLEALLGGGWLPVLAGQQLLANPTLQFSSPSHLSAIVSRYVWNGGLMWRTERRMSCRFHEAVVQLLRGLPERVTLAQLATALQSIGMSEEKAARFADQLVGAGFYEYPLPFDGSSGDALADTLRAAWAVGAPPELYDRLRQLAALQQPVVLDENAGRTRRERLRAAEQLLIELKAGPGGRVTELQGRNPLVEDGVVEGACAPLGVGQRRALEAMGRVLRRRLALHPDYVSLVQHFVNRVGPGGVCEDVYGWLADAAQFLPAWHEDDPRGLKRRATAEPRGPVGVTLYCQFDDLAPTAERPNVVLNAAFAGAAAFSARFSAGGSEMALALRGGLRGWLRELGGADEVLEAPLSSECSELQAHPALTRRVVAWPGERLRHADAEVVPLAALRLVHDQASGLVELHDRQGARLRCLYVGSVTLDAAYGERYLFRLIGQPFRFVSSTTAPTGTAFEARPRVEEHGVVLTRAKWWIPAAELRVTLRGSTGRKLLQLALQCDRWKIPRFVFASPGATRFAGGAPTKEPVKPMWLDLRNLLCVEMLEKLAADSVWVVLTEVFPLPGQSPIAGESGRHAAEFQVEMAL